MSIASRLQSAAVRNAKLQDALNDTFAGELQTVLRLTTSRVRDLVRELETDGARIAREASLSRTMRMQADIRDAMRVAGYDQLVRTATDAPLDRLATDVIRGSRTAEQAAALTAFDADALVAMKQIRFGELLQYGDDVASELWRTTIDGVLGVRRPDDLITDLEDLLDSSRAEAHTIYDTAVSTYSREVDQLQTSGEPDELFLYVGPTDERTREWCVERVGKVFTREEIEEMDNGQLPDPLITGGGYNCRHSFKPVSKLDSELRELADSGEALPHVQEQIDRLAQAQERVGVSSISPGEEASVTKSHVLDRMPSADRELLEAGNVRIDVQTAAEMGAGQARSGVSGYYDPITGRVVIGEDVLARGGGTLSHELGHAIDNRLVGGGAPGRWFWSDKNPAFSAALKADWAQISATARGKEYKRLLSRVYTPSQRTTEVFADVYATQRMGMSVRAGAFSTEEVAAMFPRVGDMLRNLAIGE